MTQTTRTVNDLIASAFYLIGEYDEEEPLDGVDFQRGFDILNFIIDSYSGTEQFLTLTKEIEFDLIPGQREYIISNVPTVVVDVDANRLAAINYFNVIFNGEWRWPVDIITPTQIHTKLYNQTLIARPRYVLLENSEEFSKLSLFPSPDQNYKVIMQAKFYLDKFEKFQPIRNIPLSMQRFLMFDLGQTLIQYYPSANWSPQAAKIHQELSDRFLASNDIDLTARSTSLLERPYNQYWNDSGLPFFSGL